MNRTATLVALLAASACQAQPEPEVPVARLPDEVCSQVRGEVARQKAAGGLQFKPGAEATIEEAAWLQMSQTTRDQILRLVAFDAACASEQPSAEQTATIRSEYGRVLAQQVVTTSADITTVLGE